MNEADALDIVNSAVWTVLMASGPAVLAAMLIGIGIALFQALTQVQEMTLTFVPKIVVIFIVLAVTAPLSARRSIPSRCSSIRASKGILALLISRRT